MNKELMESMNILEKEYNISKDTLLEAIENSLLTACKNHFGKADNVKVIIDPDGCDYSVYMEKEVVETVEDPITQISLADARMIARDMSLVISSRSPLIPMISAESRRRTRRT